MDLDLVRKLIKLVEKSDVAEFSVQEGDLKIKISKNAKPLANNAQLLAELQPAVQKADTSKAASPIPKADAKPGIPADSNLHEIRSPIVGTLYRAPAPDADPFVKVGDHIEEGDVLCIVEAMKLMNEIEADASGKIVKILADNASPVEYDQPLFLIEKS